jgi:dolichol kinase
VPKEEEQANKDAAQEASRASAAEKVRAFELPRALGHFILVGMWAINSFAFDHAVLVSIAFALCVSWEMLRRIWPFFNDLPLIRHTLRHRERGNVVTPATFFLIGLMICIKFFERDVVNTSIWVTALADPTARLVGKSWGRARILNSKKTFEGSSACFLVTAVVVFLCLYLFRGLGPGTQAGWMLAAAVLAGGLVAAGEALLPLLLPRLMDDNFWVLILASTAIYLVTLAQQWLA